LSKHWFYLIQQESISTQYSVFMWEVTITHEFWHGEIIERIITWPHVGMNFIFECSTRYLTSECSERVWTWEDKIYIHKRSVIFFLLYKRTNDEDFRRFSKIVPKGRWMFRTFFGHFPKITEYFWIFCKEAPMMFWSYSNISKYFLRDYVRDFWLADIITCKNIVFLQVKIYGF